MRGVDNPNQIFVRVEFDSAEEAKSFGEKVRRSDVLQNVDVKLPPTPDKPHFRVDGGRS